MAYNNFYNPNQPMINQLLRQKDNIDAMLTQYNQPQQPIQNIINTGASVGFEAKILKEDEDAGNILINSKTMFLDKKNKKVFVKEVDGTISEEYEIVIPLDEKDKKILEQDKRITELENIIKEMRDNNVKYAEPNRTDDEQHQSNADGNEFVKSTAKAINKSISKSTE